MVTVYTTCKEVELALLSYVNENIVYRYIGTISYKIGRSCFMHRSVSFKSTVKTPASEYAALATYVL